VYAQLRRSHSTLKLVQLGCPGETTKTMIQGGICRYTSGSQVADAVSFLDVHRGQMRLVTIDIGANDPEDCGAQPTVGKLASCIGQVPGAAANLTTILASRRAAAGPGVRIVGMSYSCLNSPNGATACSARRTRGPASGSPSPTTTSWITPTLRPESVSPTSSGPSTPPTSAIR